jgi:hypothetical protein
VDPSTHAARGHLNWKIYSPTDGWRVIHASPTCLVVTEQTDSSKTAAVIAEAVSKRGWGAGEPGGYTRFWVRDRGTPGSTGDPWIMQSYQLAPEWLEFWPADDEAPFYVEHGNLVIIN